MDYIYHNALKLQRDELLIESLVIFICVSCIQMNTLDKYICTYVCKKRK